jgi:hypothetical protein
MTTLFDIHKDLRLGCSISRAIELLGETEFNEYLKTKELEIVDSLVYANSSGIVSTQPYLDSSKKLEYLKQDSRF